MPICPLLCTPTVRTVVIPRGAVNPDSPQVIEVKDDKKMVRVVPAEAFHGGENALVREAYKKDGGPKVVDAVPNTRYRLPPDSKQDVIVVIPQENDPGRFEQYPQVQAQPQYRHQHQQQPNYQRDEDCVLCNEPLVQPQQQARMQPHQYGFQQPPRNDRFKEHRHVAYGQPQQPMRAYQDQEECVLCKEPLQQPQQQQPNIRNYPDINPDYHQQPQAPVYQRPVPQQQHQVQYYPQPQAPIRNYQPQFNQPQGYVCPLCQDTLYKPSALIQQPPRSPGFDICPVCKTAQRQNPMDNNRPNWLYETEQRPLLNLVRHSPYCPICNYDGIDTFRRETRRCCGQSCYPLMESKSRLKNYCTSVPSKCSIPSCKSSDEIIDKLDQIVDDKLEKLLKPLVQSLAKSLPEKIDKVINQPTTKYCTNNKKALQNDGPHESGGYNRDDRY